MQIERPIDSEEENIQAIDEEFGASVNPQEATEEANQETFMATGMDVVPSQAKQMLFESANPIEALIREGFYTEEMQADELQQAYDKATLKSEDFSSNPDFVYEQYKAQLDPNTDPIDIRAAVNIRTEQAILAEMTANEETGVLDAILDFGSTILREATIGIPEALTDRTERLGTEMVFNRLNMKPSEYKEWFQETANEIMQEGLRSNNANTLGWLKGVAQDNGFDSQSGLKKAFAILDLTGVGQLLGGTFKVARRAAKPRTALARITELEGPETAAQVGEGIIARKLDPEVSADLGPRVVNPHPPATATPEGWYSRALQRNKLAEEVSQIYKSGAMGRIVDEDIIRSAVSRTVDSFIQRVGNAVFKSDLEDTGFGNYSVNIQIGKAADGTPYKPTPSGAVPASVQRLAERTGGEVVPVLNSTDDLQGYVVQHRQNLDLTKEVEAIDPTELVRLERGLVRNTLGKIFGNQLLGSTALRGVDRLTTLAQMGESAKNAVKKVFETEAKKINALGTDDRAVLASIVGKLRDNPLESTKRMWYSDQEFASKYRELTGKTPSNKVLDAYDAEISISNTAAVVRANNILRTYVQKGYRAVTLPSGIRSPAKVYTKTSIADDALILDLNNNTRLLKSEIDEGFDIWKLDKPTEDGVQYITRPSKVDALDPQDVMGFNAGGPRTNPNANYFVVLGRANTNVKSLLTAFTESDALLARNQLTTIQRALRDGNGDIDNIIAANNDWNPAITNLEELNAFGKENKWSLEDGVIAHKERNSYVQEVDPQDATYKMSFADYVSADMSRQDTVLPEFGGQKSYNIDPMDTIVQQFGSAIEEFSNHAYTHNAMVGWVKKAQEAGVPWFPKEVSPNDYRNLFLNADIKGNSAFDRSMREVRNIELRRMGVKSEAAQTMEGLGQQMSEFVFQRTGVATKIGDPSNALLNIGFQSAFGFGNISQSFVQASHAMTIMAISPSHGFRGAGMAMSMRAMYHMPTKVLEEAIPRAAKYYGMEVEDLKEVMEYVRTSGRDVIDADAIEQGTGVAWGVSSFGGESYKPSVLRKAWLQTKKAANKGLEVGLIPFNAGERLGRMTGTYTAILEFKAKNPGVSLMSDRARQWITRRDQDLTFNMTAVSRPQIQSGAMRVPTQWLSHTFRAMESIFVGRNFTKAERARMFAVQMPMYGTAGFGFANAANSLADWAGIEEDSVGFTFLKWGVIDGVSDWLMEDTEGRVGTGLAGRLAPAGAIVDTYRKITEGRVLEAALGPSGDITGGVTSAFLDAYSALTEGRGTMLSEDVIKILRTPSGVDNLAKAYGIFNNGIYRSKNGVTIPTEMTSSEGIMQLLGIGSLKQAEWYSAQTSTFRSSKKFNTFRKQVNVKAEYAFDLLQSKDPADKERAFKMFNELKVMVDFSGFSPELQLSLQKSLNRRLDDKFFRTYDQLLKEDQDAAAARLRNTLGR